MNNDSDQAEQSYKPHSSVANKNELGNDYDENYFHLSFTSNVEGRDQGSNGSRPYEKKGAAVMESNTNRHWEKTESNKVCSSESQTISSDIGFLAPQNSQYLEDSSVGTIVVYELFKRLHNLCFVIQKEKQHFRHFAR